MIVVYYEVGTEPRALTIDNTLENMQYLVHGYIEEFPLDDKLSIICNEEGKINGMAANRFVEIDGEIVDLICGDFFVTACSGGDFRCLTDGEEKRALAFDYSTGSIRFHAVQG